MRKMSCIVLAIAALLTVGTFVVGCQSCKGGANSANDIRKSKEVPAVIADAKLLSYKYTLQSTMRWPLHSENVEICEDDSTRCIIRLFDESRIDSLDFDSNGDPLPDTVIVSSEVLDSVKQMIVDAKAWRFKEDYSPMVKTLDGYSWGYTAAFSVTDSMLSVTPEAQRSRLLRRGGCKLTSGGSNASPDTELFEQVRRYLQGIYETEKKDENATVADAETAATVGEAQNEASILDSILAADANSVVEAQVTMLRELLSVNGGEDEEKLRKCCTRKAIRQLNEDYDYDDPTGNNIAIWAINGRFSTDATALELRSLNRVAPNTYQAQFAIIQYDGNEETSVMEYKLAQENGEWKIDSYRQISHQY